MLVPVRRGFVSVEPLLRATYQELADDDAAAVAYLRSRPDVIGGQVAIIAQGDDAPPAIMAAAQSTGDVPTVLIYFRFGPTKCTCAGAYSITSSARPDKVSGTVIPSALAVFRLMNSSILVPCCTGNSAGFSPLRTRPT